MKFISNRLPLLLAFVLIATTSVFSQEKISDSELTNFANAFTGIQVVNEKAQNEMVATIESSGMEIDKFNVLYQASQNPNAPTPEGVSKEDSQKFEKIVVQIEQMQPKFQKEMENVIVENKLTVERYQEMIAMLQTDPELQQKLQEKMQ